MKLLRGFWKLLKGQQAEPEAILQTELPKDEKPADRAQLKEERSYAGLKQPIRRKRGKVHIQVGLDFGTSTTKVVYSQLGRRLSRSLDFKHGLPNYPNYCLPSLAGIDSHGRLLLGIDAVKLLSDKEWDSGFQRFKVIVAGNHDEAFRDPITHEKFFEYREKNHYEDSFTPERLTAIYLAHAMNMSRQIIEGFPEYKDIELDIAFNICMPIDHIENNRVQIEFERIFNWAEYIEKAWHRSGKDFDPLSASYRLENTARVQAARVFAIPESVAGIASYLLSLHKQEGLHATIDLGAGTTDVSIFNLVMPYGESTSYWYAARNIPRGTINIERLIASHINENRSAPFCNSCEVYDYLDKTEHPVTHDVNREKEQRTLQYKIFKEIKDLKNSEEYCQTWGSAFRHKKGEKEWENVQVFLCGGGSRLPRVDEVFSSPWWKNLQNLNVRYPVSRLPTPDDYVAGDSNAPFERMAIAYGLARPKPQFEDYILPRNSPDHTPPRLPVIDIDRDDLYPKP